MRKPCGLDLRSTVACGTPIHDAAGDCPGSGGFVEGAIRAGLLKVPLHAAAPSQALQRKTVTQLGNVKGEQPLGEVLRGIPVFSRLCDCLGEQ